MRALVLLPFFLMACGDDDGQQVAQSPCGEETRASVLDAGDAFTGEGLGLSANKFRPSGSSAKLSNCFPFLKLIIWRLVSPRADEVE